MRKLNILVGFERSGVSCGAFRGLGHNAWSCDRLAAADEHPCAEYHLHGDIRHFIGWQKWDLALFHPDCTYLTVSGLHWNSRGRMVDGRPRAELTAEALDMVQWLMDCDIPHWMIENPVGCISSAIRKPDQIIQPYQYGHDASKKTCLWTKGLPKLAGTRYVEPRMVGGMPRWANQTDSGQNKLGPSDDRWEQRARTYEGIANAWADQYTQHILDAPASRGA